MAEPRMTWPAPELEGGWPWLRGDDEVRAIAGMDPGKLGLACEYNARFDASASVVVIRHGKIVAEWCENSALTTTRYDIWSCVKSFTGIAYGLLFDDVATGRLKTPVPVDLDTPAYQFIPDGQPLSDPRKAKITFRHLLSMTSGIPGERGGIAAIPTEIGVGPFEAALGKAPTKARRWPSGRWTNRLSAEPGAQWDYSDPAMAHLALAFAELTGQEMAEVVQERVFDPIGIGPVAWDSEGVGNGFIGPHTNAHTGIHLCSRDLARVGWLMLNCGDWRGKQLLSKEWVELATKTSQALNSHYGYTWWVNTAGTLWPGAPRDAFAAMGYMSNRCYVVPSLGLVVARTGSGPGEWSEGELLHRVINAIVEPGEGGE